MAAPIASRWVSAQAGLTVLAHHASRRHSTAETWARRLSRRDRTRRPPRRRPRVLRPGHTHVASPALTSPTCRCISRCPRRRGAARRRETERPADDAGGRVPDHAAGTGPGAIPAPARYRPAATSRACRPRTTEAAGAVARPAQLRVEKRYRAARARPRGPARHPRPSARRTRHWARARGRRNRPAVA
jgi:hypothetical protein